MTIDKSGEFWKGSHLYDLHEYLEMAAVIHKVLHVVCDCGCQVFQVSSDYEHACVQCICINCGLEKQLRGSDELWKEATLSETICACGKNNYRIGLGVTQEENEIAGWVILGQMCASCGVLSYTANRCETVSFGKFGEIGTFIDVKHANEIYKCYPLQLYEVIYYGGAGDPDGAHGRDAIYLVAAKDFEDARDMVDRNCTHKVRNERADVVQEIGASLLAGGDTRILRGPYYEYGYEFGRRSWHRNEEDETGNTWEENEH